MQVRLGARLHARIVSLGATWFAQVRTGGMMLSVVDGVEQLQSFFVNTSRSSPSMWLLLYRPRLVRHRG